MTNVVFIVTDLFSSANWCIQLQTYTRIWVPQ